MFEFLNVLCALAAGLVAGAAIHSAYVHSKRRRSLPEFPWDHFEVDDLEEVEYERG